MNDAGDLRFTLRHAYRGATRCSDESQSQGTCGISQALDLGQSQQLTNARIAWTSPLGHWTWALYGRNLLDNQYINSLGTYGKTVLGTVGRSEEHTSELQSLMRISYAVFCLKKKNN